MRGPLRAVVLTASMAVPVWVPAAALPHEPPTPGPAVWGASVEGPCVPTDASACMLPFPNDYYTVPDRATPTGRRVDIPAGAFPAATGHAPFDPGPWEANDGFSPGSTLLTHVPGIDLARSAMATLSDIGASLEADSPVVLLDTDTGQRWPTWAELDVQDHDPATRLLMVHPAQDLTEGDHFVVALRDLRNGDGSAIPPSPAFAAVLHHAPGLSPYQRHLAAEVGVLARAGVPGRGLYLVWDFTVDSRRNLTAPALAMRDRGFAALGPHVPAYTVTRVVDDPPDKPSLAREVGGTFEVPDFLSAPGGPDGSVLHLGAGGLPSPLPGATYTASFDCEIPKVATAAHPARVGLYGHGLFGSAAEVYASGVPQFSEAHDYVFCGTDWVGLDAGSLSLAASVVTDLSAFPSLVDHLMQSLLDAQFLGRLLADPRGFARDPAFRSGPAARPGGPVIDPRAGLVYYGNSEGGIMGGAFIALSTEVRRAVLGVPGMDYDVLLARSADFAPFLGTLNHAYPDRAVQDIGFDLVQMLWDRGEADGYAEQMTGGLPGTPRHQVLLEEAFGDHQVANVTTETEARTIGARLAEPALRPGRSDQAVPFWDLAPLHAGAPRAALFVWDSGVPAPPQADVPATAGPDPHDTTPRDDPVFWTQMDRFFRTGRVPAGCGPSGCRAPYPPTGG